MALEKSIILVLVSEQRGHNVEDAGSIHTFFQQFKILFEGAGSIISGTEGCPHGGKTVAVFRKDGVIGI